MPEPFLINAADAAERLGISRALLYAMHSSGELGPMPHRFGRRKVVWAVEDLQEWVRHGCPPRAEWVKMKEARP